MSATAAVCMEGVLKHPETGARCVDGITLYASLVSMDDVLLFTSEPREELEHWMAENGVPRGEAGIIEDSVTFVDDRVQSLRHARLSGYGVDVVVAADPWLVRAAFEEGFTALLFLNPAYARPEWRPDTEQGVKTWESISHQVADEAYQRSLRAEITAGP
jgi:hypothetical protein